MTWEHRFGVGSYENTFFNLFEEKIFKPFVTPTCYHLVKFGGRLKTYVAGSKGS